MIGTRITEAALRQAVAGVNAAHHTDNLQVDHFHSLSGRRCSFTLRVRDSHGPLARTSASGRHGPWACWHAHGEVFDRLLAACPQGRIKTAFATITSEGGNWQDTNCGSMMYPRLMSECCECPGAWLGMIAIYEAREREDSAQ